MNKSETLQKSRTRQPTVFSRIFRLTVDFLLKGKSRDELSLYAPRGVSIPNDRINSNCSGGGIKKDTLDTYLSTIENYLKETDMVDELWDTAEDYMRKANAIFEDWHFIPISYDRRTEKPRGDALAAAIFEFVSATLMRAYRYYRSEFKSDRRASTHKRLVAFDLDGTLIKNMRYSWELLRDIVGIKNSDDDRRREQFECGKLSYRDWIKMNCQELKTAGLTRALAKEAVDTAKKNGARLTNNFHEAIMSLKQKGCFVALVSGGVDCVLYDFVPDANELFDKIYINKLIFDGKDGLLSDVIPTRYDGGMHCKGVNGGKEGALIELCSECDISVSDSVFVGDDTNDFGVMERAGLSIFYYVPSMQGGRRSPGKVGWPKYMNMICDDDLSVVADKIIAWYDERN